MLKRTSLRVVIPGLLISVLVVGLAVSGCNSQATTTDVGPGPGTGTATRTSTESGSIKVSRNGQIIQVLSPAELDAMPKTSMRADNKDYSGPSIASILANAGIPGFTSVTVVGYAKGRLATAELKLARAQVNDNLILRKTNQGTFSLASPDVNPNDWVIDVNELRVE